MLKRLIVLSALLCSFGASPLAAIETLAGGKKIALQSYAVSQMQSLLLSDGIQYADALAGEIKFISPTATHPMIFSNGTGMFVLCFDGVDQYGEQVPIDVYVVENGSDFRLQDIRFGSQSRADFEVMMRAGMFSPV